MKTKEKTWCLTSAETIRFIRDGERSVKREEDPAFIRHLFERKTASGDERERVVVGDRGASSIRWGGGGGGRKRV